jgi:hypothetical protein
MEESKMEARGIRNNNPLNIRKSSDKWQGLSDNQTDSAFFQFKTMAYGFRAAIKILQTYHTKYKCVSIADYINRWAPSIENNTARYIRVVCNRLQVPSVYTLDTNSKADMCNLVAAMAFMENGVEVDMKDVEEGWRLL